MKTTYVVKIGDITFADRLRGLIDDDAETHYQFVKNFNNWLKEKQLQGKYIDQPDLDTGHLSRWLNKKEKNKKGKYSMPKIDKIQMFADYFKVDPEYLACTQYDKHKPDIHEISMEDIKKQEETDALIAFLENYGFKIHVRLSDTEAHSVENQYCIIDNCIYREVLYFESHFTEYEIIYPDKKKIIISAEKFELFSMDTVKYIKYLLNEMRDNSSHKD